MTYTAIGTRCMLNDLLKIAPGGKKSCTSVGTRKTIIGTFSCLEAYSKVRKALYMTNITIHTTVNHEESIKHLTVYN
jgi:hypothetical protein